MTSSRWTSPLLTLTLCLAPLACGDGGGAMPTDGYKPSPVTSSSDESLESEDTAATAEAEIEAADIPSQDAADAAADEAIDESNADAAFEELLREIEADGG